MKTIVVEGDGIALDRLIFQATGREDMVPATLDANPGLARLGPVVPVGTVIRVPEPVGATEAVIVPTITLWSE